MFFNGWYPLLRVVVVGAAAYVALVVILRVTGKRTLSKFNAFDLIVTVALGSTLATVLLTKDVALVEGVTAFAVLVGLQYVVAWLSVRSRRVDWLIKSEPRLVFYRGHFLHDAMRAERITESEILAAVREQGIASLEEVDAVVLETAGSVSVVRGSRAAPSALRGVRGASDAAGETTGDSSAL